ncbi:MAG: hypothetical protein HAW66_02650 [Shewanella sp.]|nr:hypothetical protein [Shewanella sp.]
MTVISFSVSFGMLLCGVGAAGFAIGSDYISSKNHTVDDHYYENMMFAASIGGGIGLFFGARIGAIVYPLVANPTKLY